MASVLAKVKEVVGEKVEEIKEVIRDERRVGDMEHRKHEIAAKPELLAADQLLRLRIVSADFIKEDDYHHAFAVVTVGRNVARTLPRPLIDPKVAHTGSNSDYIGKQRTNQRLEEQIHHAIKNPNVATQGVIAAPALATAHSGHHADVVPPAAGTVGHTTHDFIPETSREHAALAAGAATHAHGVVPDSSTTQHGFVPETSREHAALAAGAGAAHPGHGVIPPAPIPGHTPASTFKEEIATAAAVIPAAGQQTTSHLVDPTHDTHHIPKTGYSEKEVNWEEHFSIEYNKGAEDEPIIVEVFAKTTGKDVYLGGYRMRIGDVVAPKHRADRNVETTNKSSDHKSTRGDNWSFATPHEYPLTGKKGGAKVGTISMLLRREEKLYGNLRVSVKEAYLDQTNQQIRSAKCIMKLVNEFQETESVTGASGTTANTFRFLNATKHFDINTKNHVFDLFIELWNTDTMHSNVGDVTPIHGTRDSEGNQEEINRGDKKVIINPNLMGQARVTLYDARDYLNEAIPIFTFDNRHVGYMRVEAELLEDDEKKHMAKKDRDQAQKILNNKTEQEEAADARALRETKHKAVHGVEV